MSYNIHFPTEKLLLNHSSSQFQSWPMQGCPFLCGIQLSFKSTLFIKYTVPHPMKATSRQNIATAYYYLKKYACTLILCVFTLMDKQLGCISFWKMKNQEIYFVLVHIWTHQIPWLFIQKQLGVQHQLSILHSHTVLNFFTEKIYEVLFINISPFGKKNSVIRFLCVFFILVHSSKMFGIVLQ